jgi:cyclic-di-GMP-binding protein
MQLSVPNRTAPRDGAFDSRPASVKSWIDALPMANIGETTRLLYAAINDLNHQDIPAAQRFKALEMLHRPVQYVGEHMKKHFVGQALPLPVKNLKIARLSRDMSLAMATGYKILVTEQIAADGRKDKKLLLACLQRALRHLSQVLLKTYQAYEPCPPPVWLEMHSLYRYAENNNLHRSPVSEGANPENRSSTISDTYKQILLLALACPYRLRHGEAESVYNVLQEWAALSELEALDPAREALFSVNLDADQPPAYRVRSDDRARSDSSRLLDTRRLAARVRKALTERKQSAGKNRQGALRENTLRRLMLSWGIMPKRRFSRARDHSQVIVSMGLSSIHYFVSGEVAFNEASPELECYRELGAIPQLHYREPAYFSARITRESRGKTPDVWEMNYRIEGVPDPSNTELAVARAAAGMPIDTSHCTQSWKMVNVSAGGYCMLWDNPETTRAQVGELLGIREESDPDTFHWRLGVIRWLKFEDKRGLELGVQMLSPGAVAIAARMDTRNRRDQDYTRGLLLPEIASIQQRASVLLPSPPFKVGDTAIANCHGRDVRVKLTELVENTGSFAQFQFESLGEIELAKQRQQPHKPAPKDYDDVWELL